MSFERRVLRVGTRGSSLALVQTRSVTVALQAAYRDLQIEEVVISTRGDRLLDRPFAAVGSRGIFARELEAALLKGQIDLAVHSLKDLESAMPAELLLGAIPPRADPRDALVAAPGATLATLPPACRIATSSIRRAALLRHLRPDVRLEAIRGNVPTRLNTARERGLDGLILACAGLDRLGRADAIAERLDPAVFLPEAGQGAIAVQIRAGDAALRAMLAPLDDPATAACCRAERACAGQLEGSCQTPIAAYATHQADGLHLTALVCAADGGRLLREEGSGPAAAPEALGRAVAMRLLAAGAADLLL